MPALLLIRGSKERARGRKEIAADIPTKGRRRPENERRGWKVEAVRDQPWAGAGQSGSGVRPSWSRGTEPPLNERSHFAKCDRDTSVVRRGSPVEEHGIIAPAVKAGRATQRPEESRSGTPASPRRGQGSRLAKGWSGRCLTPLWGCRSAAPPGEGSIFGRVTRGFASLTPGSSLERRRRRWNWGHRLESQAKRGERADRPFPRSTTPRSRRHLVKWGRPPGLREAAGAVSRRASRDGDR